MGTALERISDLTVIASRQAENIQSWRDSGIRTIEVDTYNGVGSFLLSTLNPRRVLCLRRALHEAQPDVLYYPMLHAWTPLINVLSGHLPNVLTIHDVQPHLG
jgi:hypothetical protein